MTKPRITLLAAALTLTLTAVPAAAASDVVVINGEELLIHDYQGTEGDIGCIDVIVTNHSPTPGYELITKDEGVRHAAKGHFLTIAYAWASNSETNLVSTDLDTVAIGDRLNVCTTWIPTGTVIPEGEASVARIVTVQTPTGKTITAPHSTLSPHPDIIDAWITDNGYTVL